ncbi:efflux RND transporter periplasmic adaptor subunit [Asticcacaulis benevestitus]|uniref:RND efflux pump membrane fusion protein barrel-sandwich domain-containing protein n=1 Tax=Asticcacaulis benevestitus DSM 16100 = ATCC BAA-896 TaxID=1121022 RepID=V4PYQ3_9CAUL|nr:HlyD family efflux transporter periplasmic adaptor subunit [Asticcacaulis benevestitus]ESQ92549.1 hypothetical protein ABENE_07890 [Asticcacaulis benevestitus DSM 16100 = ATCC BAA-896]
MSYASRHPLLTGASALLLAALVWAGWSLVRPIPSGSKEQMQELVVTKRPFTATLNVVGAVVAGDSLDLTAPFEGTVRFIGFDYGDMVVKGQRLFVIDTSLLEQSRRDAKTAQLKASQAARDMAAWKSGPEVSRARRAVAVAEMAVANTHRKIVETKDLLDQGLVPRNEYDALLQEKTAQDMSLVSAREDMTQALARGEGENRQVASLDLQSANAKLHLVNDQMGNAVIFAPISGVIGRPSAEKGEGGATGALRVGQRISQGQSLGFVADAENLAVALQLNETDIQRVKVGQMVRIGGSGFGDATMTGRVASISGEGTPAQMGGGVATFAVRVQLDTASKAQTQTARIGMTANAAIVIYETRAAIVLPPQALQNGSNVLVKDLRTHKVSTQQVTTGEVSPEGVEILGGLKSGDTVLYSQTGTTQKVQ